MVIAKIMVTSLTNRSSGKCKGLIWQVNTKYSKHRYNNYRFCRCGVIVYKSIDNQIWQASNFGVKYAELKIHCIDLHL